MIQTKYGEITTEQFNRYKQSIINRIYAILPMKEEQVTTVGEYIQTLNRELVKNLDMFINCERILSVVCILESLITENDHEVYRKDVLHCCNIIARLGDE